MGDARAPLVTTTNGKKCHKCQIGARSVAGVMSNGAPSADAKSGDGRARDGGRAHAMSRGGMSCDGATSVGKASRTLTGGMTSGAATTPLGAVAASSDGTLSHTQLSAGATSHCEANDGRIMTGGTLSGAAATTDQA